MIRVFLFIFATTGMLILGSPTAEAGGAYTDSRFGLNHIWYNPTKPSGASCTINRYPDYASIGVRWVRPHPGRAIWGLREPSQGTFVWGALDQEVIAAQNNGFEMLMTLFPYANWDYANCGVTSNSYVDPSFFQELGPIRQLYCTSNTDMQTWLTELMARYDSTNTSSPIYSSLSHSITHFEVSNEPSIHDAIAGGATNSELFWHGDYADYATLLDDVHDEIMSYSTINEVLNGGMIRYEIPAYNDVHTYWQNVFSTISTASIDHFSYHAVEMSHLNEDSNVLALKSALNVYGISGTPIWVTELEFNETEVWAKYGPYGSGTGRWSQIGSGTRIDYQQAAEHMVDVYVQTFVAGAEKIFLAGDYDDSIVSASCTGFTPTANDNRFELLDQNNTKTANWYAFKTLIGQLDYFQTATTVTTDKAWKFTYGTKNDIYVVAHDEKPSDHLSSIYSLGDNLVFTDIFGNTTNVTIPASGATTGPFYTAVGKITYITKP